MVNSLESTDGKRPKLRLVKGLTVLTIRGTLGNRRPVSSALAASHNIFCTGAAFDTFSVFPILSHLPYLDLHFGTELCIYSVLPTWQRSF